MMAIGCLSAYAGAPVASNQTITTLEDLDIVIPLQATDPDSGDVLTYSIVSNPSSGTLGSISGNKVTYTPSLNFNGDTSFTFRVSDGTSTSQATVYISVLAVNDAPSLNGVVVNGKEDQAVAFSSDVFKAQYSDQENDPFTSLTVVTLPLSGKLLLNGTPVTSGQAFAVGALGGLSYEPAANENGAKSFTVRASDDMSLSALSTVTVLLAPVDDIPVATAQSVEVTEDTAKAITLAGTDVDTANNILTFSVVSQPANGTLVVAGSSVTYTPKANFNGSDSFTFKANDGSTDSLPATVSLTVSAVNDVPVATAPAPVTTAEDTAVEITLGGSDVETSANSLIYSVVTQPAKGKLSGSGSKLTYTPDADYAGPDSFTYVVNDGTVNSAPANVAITVTAVNDSPVATAQSVEVTEDTAKGITLAGTDIDTANNLLTFSVVSQPANGTLVVVGSSVTYTPKANFNGSDSFTFKANDGSTDSQPATVSLTVKAVNDVPVATAPAPVTTLEDTAVEITLGGSDVETSANSLIYTVVTQPTKGKLSGSGSKLTYTPNADYNGPDAFTYVVNDGTVDSAPATVTIAVTSVIDPPVAKDVKVEVLEQTPTVAKMDGYSPENVALTYTVLTLPQRGSLTLNGNAVVREQVIAVGDLGKVTYTPETDFADEDAFTYKVSHTLGGKTVNSQVGRVTLAVLNVNDAPSFEIPRATLVAGDKGSYVPLNLVSAPWTGVAISGNGSVVLKSAPNSVEKSTDGGKTWSSFVSVGSGEFNAVAVSADGNTSVVARGKNLIVNGAVSSAPQANWTSVASSADGKVLVGVADGSKIYTSVNSGVDWTASESARAWQAVVASADGKNLAAAVYGGQVYTSVDSGKTWTARGIGNRYWGALASSADGKTLAAAEVDGQIHVSTDGGATWSIGGEMQYWSSIAMSADGKQILASVYGGRLYYSNDTGATWSLKEEERIWGLVAMSADGKNVLAAELDGDIYQSVESFTEFVVTAVEDTFTTVSGFATKISAGPANEAGQVVSFELSSNNPDLFAEGPAISTGGTLSFTPASDKVGQALVTVTARDNGGVKNGGVDQSASKTFVIQVNGVNDAPVAGSQVVAVVEDTAKAITLAAFDAENDQLTYAIVRGPGKGVLSGTAPNLTYTPAANVNGADSFTFKVSDGKLESSVATVSITIAAVQDAPVASNQAVKTDEDAPVAITLGGSDADNEALTYTIVSAPTQGELTGTAPNLVYVPNSEVSGTDSFTFKVNDGKDDSNVATVTITVNAVNDAPVAGALAVKTDEDTAVAVTLQGYDAEGANLKYTVVRQPANGVLSGEGANLEYAPNPDFNGVDSFTYKVSDGSLESSTVTVAITVTSVYDPAVALTQSLKVVQSSSAAVELKAYNPDNSKLTYTVVSQPKQGTLSGTAPNLVYTANADATGTDSFTFRVNDGTSNSGQATVLIAIGEASKLAIKSNDGTTLTLGVRAPKGAVVRVENATKLGTWSATAIKVTGEGTNVEVPVTLQIDKSVPVRFWRLNVLSMP